MALGPWGTISEWTFAGISESVGERLPFPSHYVWMGGPHPTEEWSRRSVESSAVSGMAGDSGHSLATGDEPRTLVWHVIQGPSFNGGNATTQGRLSYANELRHSRPIRTGIARNGIDYFATNYRRRLFSEYGGTVGGPRGTRTQSLCTDGGARTMETYAGPCAVCGNTILNMSSRMVAAV